MNPGEMLEAAAHEAGHAVMMELLDLPYDRISIARGRPRCAWRWVSNVERDVEPVRRAIMALAAGAAAQWVLLARGADAQRRYIGDSGHELALAARLLSSVTDDDGEIDRLVRRTVDLLKRNVAAVEAVANRLLKRPTLTRREVGEILGATLVGCEPAMS
jgi:hypothetical protein